MGGKVYFFFSLEFDYWGDELWIVDCFCGVSFDDGEEMVECDECVVWVYIVCCCVFKGFIIYVCDKCKSKKKKEFEEVFEIFEVVLFVDFFFFGVDILYIIDFVCKFNEVFIFDCVYV